MVVIVGKLPVAMGGRRARNDDFNPSFESNGMIPKHLTARTDD